MSSDSVLVGVLAQLSADAELAALVNNAFFIGSAPEGLTRFVLIVLNVHLDEPMFGRTAYEEFDVLAKAVMTGTSVDDARAAGARIDARLHFQQYPIAGYVLMKSIRVEYVDFPDLDEVGRTWRHCGGRYGVTAHTTT